MKTKIIFTDIAGMLERDEMKEVVGGSGENYSAGGTAGYTSGTALGGGFTGNGFGGSAYQYSSSYGSGYGSGTGSTSSGSGSTNTSGMNSSQIANYNYYASLYGTSAQGSTSGANTLGVSGAYYGIYNPNAIPLNNVTVINAYQNPAMNGYNPFSQYNTFDPNNIANGYSIGGNTTNGSSSEPIPWYRRWYGEQAKAWQWYGSSGVYDDASFNAAALYCTKNLKTSPFENIYQRNAYYGWADSKLTKTSKWFAAAEIVTRKNAVGAADFINGPVLDTASEKFLKDGNAYLFSYNMANAKSLMETGKLTGSFINANGSKVTFNGLTGKTLDYAMVQYEQTKVQDFISQYKTNNPTANMNEIFQKVNGSFGAPALYGAPNEIIQVMNNYFGGGKSFNFSNFNDRVLLGQKIIDQLYKP